MAGAGFKDFQAGAKLTAEQVDTYLMQQSVMRFASSAARSSAIGTAVAEGMVSYLQDSNSIEVYNGSSWVGLETTLNDGTAGYTALSNGTAGITYQPVSHNYIINGAFDVWQRGTSFIVNSSGAYSADRWRTNYTTAAPTDVTLSRQAFSPGDIEAIGFGDAQFYARWTVTTLGSGVDPRFNNRIEGVGTLAGQTATLSFWARSSSSYTATINLNQTFGTGGSSTVANSGSASIGTTWQRHVVTFSLASIAGKTIGTANTALDLTIFVNDTDGSTTDFWGVQLEAGSVATPFRRHAPSLQGELAACQRYYRRIGGIGNAFHYFGTGFIDSSSVAYIYIPLPTTMRAAPSVATSGTFRLRSAASFGVTFGTIFSQPELVNFTINSSGLTAGRGAGLDANGDANAFIEFSSEL